MIRLICCTFVSAAVWAQDPRPLIVWLIPSEAAAARADSGGDIGGEIDAFNRQLAGGRVRVVNTIAPHDQQLIVWNQAFAVPNWAWVKNQTETIRALQRFAQSRNVDVHLRFITWDRAFADHSIGASGGDARDRPDVAQIGTTWAAYFVANGRLVSRPEGGDGRARWGDIMGKPAIVLPYVTDVRLLYYWKRRPDQAPDSPGLRLNPSSWRTILDSLRSSGSADRLAFASGVTLNLFFDYSMLVRDGGAEPIVTNWFRSYADFTSDAALAVPRLITEASSSKLGRALVTVPEDSHEKVSQDFAAGRYRGTIEPANFISRWKKDFDKTFQGKRNFWDYAAAVVPPATFRGGSYLAVMNTPNLPTEAFQLAEFLATDSLYTEILARNAHLPALRPGNGMDVLSAWLSENQRTPKDDAAAAEFSSVVQQAVVAGRGVADLARWPVDMEGMDVQEALQRLWRRVGEGDPVRLRDEARMVEEVLNRKVDWWTQLGNLVGRYWAWLLTAGLAVAAFLWRNNRRTVQSLEQVNQLRGFSAMALLALARHHGGVLKAYGQVAEGDADAKKRALIAAGISGWRRAHNEKNWQPGDIRDVVWRSVLLAFDIVSVPDLYEKWEESPGRDPQTFLKTNGYLREEIEAVGVDPSYYVGVEGGEGHKVPMPFLFEQAMACLLQNALQAVDVRSDDQGPREEIIVRILSDRVTVSNPGETFSADTRALINGCKSLEVFERAVLNAVRTSRKRPIGIGLTEAFAIATRCYGGLHISEDSSSVSILLKQGGTR